MLNKSNKSYIKEGSLPLPRIHGWMYPGRPAHESAADLQALDIAVVRAQFFNLKGDGKLQRLDEDIEDIDDTINGFSKRTVSFLKKYSEEQLVTVGAQLDGLRALLAKDPTTQLELIDTLVSFCVHHKLSGIDFDVEGFGRWTTLDYDGYLRLVHKLGSALHENGLKLAVCGPADQHPTQVSWCFQYRDMVQLPIDYITIMCYDYMYLDSPGGPIAPLEWIGVWTHHLLHDLSVPAERLVVGLPAYSYRQIGGSNSREYENLTFSQIRKTLPADLLAAAERDPFSAELMVPACTATQFERYRLCDDSSVTAKARFAISAGAISIALWHLGGNPIHGCCVPRSDTHNSTR